MYIVKAPAPLYLCYYYTIYIPALLRNKRFLLKFLPQKNAFSIFRFVLLYFFPFMNAMVYVDIDQGIHQGGKGLTDRAKLSKVAGSFYAMVFMTPSVCSSIYFC